MNIYKRLNELGIELPAPPKPVASYIPAVKTGNLLYLSGQTPMLNMEMVYSGKVGQDLTEDEGYQAARLCAINCLSQAQTVLEDLNQITRVIKLNGYVNSGPGFYHQPFVMNGASDLLVEILGEKGKHARTALAAPELPFNAAVEVELILEVAE